VFSNRLFGWKLGAALAAIAVMGVYSSRRGDDLNPALWRCVAQPEEWNETRLWIPSARIVSIRDTWYEIASGDPEVTIRVDGATPGKRDERIALTGTFRSDGPRLITQKVRVLPPRARLRWLAEAVSVAVVLVVLANLGRHFLFRPKVLQFEGEPRG
jgi:hypothetical protein